MTARRVRIASLVLLAACGGSPKEPAKPPGKVVTSEAQIDILEPITFTGEIELTPGSYRTLDAVAETFAGNPEIKKVEIGVFVLDGDPAARQQLADRRARRIVDYLVGKQVAADRLAAQGYVTPEEGHRTSGVRFLILERSSSD